MNQWGWFPLGTVGGSAGLLAEPEVGNVKIRVPVQVQYQMGGNHSQGRMSKLE